MWVKFLYIPDQHLVSVYNLADMDYSRAIEERIKEILKQESDLNPLVLREWLHLEYTKFQELTGNLNPKASFLKILQKINPPE